MIRVEETERPSSIELDYRREYKIEAHLGGVVWLDENMARVPSAVQAAKETIRRELIEHVFGEFREPLARLSLAIYNGEPEEAQEIVSNIRRTMFDG